MNVRRRLMLFPISMAILLSVGSGISAASGLQQLSDTDRVVESIHAVRLQETLERTKPTAATEDLALARALQSYERRATPDDFSSLTEFLSQYPESGWVPALLTNLGFSYLHHGHFTKALSSWEKAWHLGKDATDPRVRPLIDGAAGELARLYMSFGRIDQLTKLFEEIGDRPVSGPATEAVQVARETLLLAEKDPRHLFICGPRALSSLMLVRGADAKKISFVYRYRAGPDGTSLADVARLAEAENFHYRLVFRAPGQPVPRNAIVHWKVGHFAAIIGEANGRFQVKDPVFPGQDIWVTATALDAEATGYFLVSAAENISADWRAVGLQEAGSVWGKGPTNGTRPGDAGDEDADKADNECPLCVSNIKESSVSVSLSDQPVGYSPPIGPSTKVRITYNQREASQPSTFSFYNVGQKWTLSWLSYVTDDPTNLGANVSRYLSGGGAFYYSGYSSSTGRFTAQDTDGSVLELVSQSPITYQRRLRDGGIETYGQSDGSSGYPRRIFLTKAADPQGNALTFTYDGQLRLTTVTDAVGRQTTLSYTQPSRPLLVTKITDPFGRSASLTYDQNGLLTSITDVIGLTSSFGYDTNSLVNSMTTPYGTTTFAYTAPGTASPPRFVQIIDPMGFSQRVEWLEPAPISGSDNPATVPTGMPVMPTNQFLEYRNSFYWSKDAYVAASCTPSGGCDYTKARIKHFLHVPPNTSIKNTSVESVKYPLENRIWYNYAGQSSSLFGGSYNQPTAIGRVLDDGSTQLQKFTYDPVTFNLTQSIDPLGRTTNYVYANHIDLQAITQTTAKGDQTTIAQYAYNYQHLPLSYVDAAGQMTTYAYNAVGQMTSTTNPLNQTTKYQYDTDRNLSTVINANNATAATYTYDTSARVLTFTDSEGWVLTYDYDAADRITKVTYPDGTSQTYTYDKLDLVSYRDREGRVWAYEFDANRRMTKMIDPLGGQTLYGYNRVGQLTSLTDPKTYVTAWSYDVQGRLSTKQYPNTSTVTYTYENTTSRLKSETDPLGQTKQLTYAKDDQVTGISYISPVNPTSNVTFAYDSYFPRIASFTDGIGTTSYVYGDVGQLGALKVQQEIGPLSNSTVTYGFDELARINGRTVQGASAETIQYDAIGRQSQHVSALGTFAFTYLGETGQITQRQLASANLVTNWSYLANIGDRRLSQVSNVGLSTSHFSNFQFSSSAEVSVVSITQTSDVSTTYPSPPTQTATFNNLNQLTNLSGQAVTYDSNGNLLSDGQRSYTWDAENRLIRITYPGVTGKQTNFVYDGLGRRVAITRTPPGGGGGTTTSYIWCAFKLCQARDATNATVRSYFEEGEFVPGSPSQSFYYGVDQLGSVRRAFASTSSAPAYDFDPWGNALSGSTPLTDFGYAGMFRNADSGLYLTLFRAYDPVAGRWLSRDPIGEIGNQGAYRYLDGASLYLYALNSPTRFIDPQGENALVYAALALAVIAHYEYYSWNRNQPPTLPQQPWPLPPDLGSNVCTVAYPKGRQQEARNYIPIPPRGPESRQPGVPSTNPAPYPYFPVFPRGQR